MHGKHLGTEQYGPFRPSPNLQCISKNDDVISDVNNVNNKKLFVS